MNAATGWITKLRGLPAGRSRASAVASGPVFSLGERLGLLQMKRRGLSRRGAKELYRHPESFVDLLQCAEYAPESGLFVLNDAGESVAALFELRPVDVAGRPPEFLIEVRDRIVQALTILPERDDSPWVVQFFVQDEPLTALSHRVRHYTDGFPHGRPDFRDAYLKELDRHFEVLTQRGGLFVDRTGARWGGRYRRVRMVLYRMQTTRRHQGGLSPEDELSDVVARLSSGLGAAGIRLRMCQGADYYEWLMPWLNPKPEGSEDGYALLGEQPYPRELDACGTASTERIDLGEAVLKRYPVSDLENGFWWFSDLPHTAVSVDRYFRVLAIGHWTLERNAGQDHAVLLDQLPEGSVVGTTIVIAPQDEQELKVESIYRAAVGGSARAQRTGEDAAQALGHLADGRKLMPVAMQVFLHAETAEALVAARTKTLTMLRAAHLDPIESGGDSVALDSYVRHLPMAYQPEYDQDLYRRRGMWDKQVVNLLPLFGSGVGTGNPGLVFSNPAGEPLMLDPLNDADREMNAHALILGPTGSGKSVLLNGMIAGMLAVHNPYVVIIDVGGSFQLLGEHLKRHGYSVNHLKLTPDNDVSMPPFADGLQALDQYYGVGQQQSGAEDEQRDLLSEMEIAARYMITGGVPSEELRFRREDIMTVRHALFRAAWNVKRANRKQVMVEDAVAAMRELAGGAPFVESDQTLSTERRERAAQMADAMNVFSTGLGARFFNRPGELWPECDVTIVDLGHLARDGYQDALIMTYIGLMNRINDDIERRRGGDRQTLIVNDEAHITTTNPLLARYLVKASKMWRKLGAWLWIGTQNLRDFPDESATLLNMAEWWFCLSMPKEEVDQIARFQRLEAEERSMLISARKEPGRFIEGVILSKRVRTMFRNVPPALYLALAQTEQKEYARRRGLMREHGIDELDAAYRIAEHLDQQRCTT